MKTNPDRDYHIIEARKALLGAQETLAAKKTPYAALEVQHQKTVWDALRRLELVKSKGKTCP